jgi:hypothetical protein
LEEKVIVNQVRANIVEHRSDSTLDYRCKPYHNEKNNDSVSIKEFDNITNRQLQ